MHTGLSVVIKLSVCISAYIHMLLLSSQSGTDVHVWPQVIAAQLPAALTACNSSFLQVKATRHTYTHHHYASQHTHKDALASDMTVQLLATLTTYASSILRVKDGAGTRNLNCTL
jgi:hypothetical protein